VRRAESLKGEPEGLVDLLEAPTPGVSLVFLIAKADRRRAVWRDLLQRARVTAAEPLKGQALRGYVADELRRRRLSLTPDGQQELIERVGQDLRRLIGEIDKLEAYRVEGQALSAEQVSQVLGRGLTQPMYLLSDAVAERDRPRTLELLESLVEGGEKSEWILGALHRSLRQVRATLALEQAGVPRDEMARRLGLPPNLAFKLSGLQTAARRWSEPDLRAALLALAGADRQLKLGADPRLTLGVAVVRALSGAGPTRLGRSRGC
jgi:DNA polymerase III subunit delta